MNNPNDIAPGNNPYGLTNAQVGDGYRLLTTEEIEARDIVAGPLMAEETIECWGNGCWHSGYVGHALDFTYRVPASAGSFIPAPPKPEADKDALLAEMAGALESAIKETERHSRMVGSEWGFHGKAADAIARYKEAPQ